MFAEERQNIILDMIVKNQSVKVADLSNLLETSEVTIRRDLDVLQQKKMVVRTHGGAILPYSVGKAVTSQELMTHQVAEKQAIAAKAYDLIDDYDTLLLDSSSTVFELCKLITEKNEKKIRIVTTSLQILHYLGSKKGIHTMFIGGDVNVEHQTVEGYSAIRFIRGLRVDKCFIGINGIDQEFGFSTPRFEDAEIKNQMISSSVESYILADHSKFGKVYLAHVEPSNCLVTDQFVQGWDFEKIDEELSVIYADGTEMEAIG